MGKAYEKSGADSGGEFSCYSACEGRRYCVRRVGIVRGNFS